MHRNQTRLFIWYHHFVDNEPAVAGLHRDREPGQDGVTVIVGPVVEDVAKVVAFGTCPLSAGGCV